MKICFSLPSFLSRANEEQEGTQIDLLIDRNDHVINLCEIKFYNDVLMLTKSDTENIRKKNRVFKFVTKTKKQIFITLITPFGMIQDKNTLGLIDQALTSDALFDSSFS